MLTKRCTTSSTSDGPHGSSEFRRHAVERGFRSFVSVPMLRGTSPRHHHRESGATRKFSTAEIALLQTFADQAVIAIENVRLFTELQARNRDLTAALEQQTATGEILRVISRSPTDVQPVFDAICDSAVRLLRWRRRHVLQVDGDRSSSPRVDEHATTPDDAASKAPFPRSCRLDGAARARPSAIARRQRRRRRDRCRMSDSRGRDARHPVASEAAAVVPLLRARRGDRRDLRVARREPGGLHRPAGRAAADLRRPGGDRDRERPAVRASCRSAPPSSPARSSELHGARRGRPGCQLHARSRHRADHDRRARRRSLPGPDGGAIYEYDVGTRGVRPAHHDRMPDGASASACAATPDSARAKARLGRLAVTRGRCRSADIAGPRRLRARLRDRLVGAGYRALLAMPLLREDRARSAVWS